MHYSPYRWESIHALGYSYTYVSGVHLVLDIVCNHEFCWYHGYLNNYIPCYIHAIIELEVFDVNAHLSGFYARDDAVYMQFHCG